MRRIWIALIIIWVAIELPGKLFAQRLAFEVASIKPQEALFVMQGKSAPEVFDRRAATLGSLISYAFNVPMVKVVGGPAWMSSDRWDIVAKADRVRPESEVRQMVATLLEDRFSLRTHRALQAMQVFELVVARADRRLGPSLRPATGACRPFQDGSRSIAEAPVDAKGVSACINLALNFPDRTAVRLNDRTLASFAEVVERALGRPVVDKTGLVGTFDISFDFLQRRSLRLGPAEPPDALELPTALRELLGLELRSATADVEVLVVDSAQKPTPN